VSAVSLLIEVAKADHTLSSEEETKLIHTVKSLYGLSDAEQEELIELARQKSDASTSLYEYTSVINEHYSQEEKFQLVTLMWKIALSDNDLDRYEEHLIRRVADLIYLPHMKFIEAKHLAGSQ
jgi:uncharacterized tellurite resistance protein B-like protein